MAESPVKSAINIKDLTNNDFQLIRKVFLHHMTASVLAMLGVMVSPMINSIFISDLFGSEGLAAMSVVSPIYFIFAALGSLLGVGGCIQASYDMGQYDTAGVNRAFSLSLAAIVAISIGISICGFVFLPELLCVLGSDELLYEMEYSYASVYITGGMGTALFYLPYNFLKLAGRLKLLVIIFLGMAFLNAGLDFVFLFYGHVGISGAAWATVISSFVMGIIGTGSLLHGRDALHLVRLNNICGSIKLAWLGSPASLNNMATFLRGILLNQLLLFALGEAGLASWGIILVLDALALVIVSGISQAAAPFFGVFASEEDVVSVWRILYMAMKIGMAAIIFLVVAIIFFAPDICRLFHVDQSESGLAIQFFALSLVPSVVSRIWIAYYQSAGFTSLANILTLGRAVLFPVGLSYIFMLWCGASSIWAAFLGAEILTLLLGLCLVKIYCHKQGYDRFLLLDDEAETAGRCLSFAVPLDIHAIVGSIQKVEVFCRSNKLAFEKMTFLALALEEMMTSIEGKACFDYKTKEYIYIRIVISAMNIEHEQKVILRLRHGGGRFNPISYYEANQSAGIIENKDSFGIGLILKLAKKIDYEHTFGINNITIIL